jgi:hypothetical protein
MYMQDENASFAKRTSIPVHQSTNAAEITPSVRNTGNTSNADTVSCHYDTCMVVDICQWTDDMNTCIKCRFPEVQMSTVHSTISLTGFSIVMRIPGCLLDGYELVEHQPNAFGSRSAHTTLQRVAGAFLHSDSGTAPTSGNVWTSMPNSALSIPYRIILCIGAAPFILRRIFRGQQQSHRRGSLSVDSRSQLAGLFVSGGILYALHTVLGLIQKGSADHKF